MCSQSVVKHLNQCKTIIANDGCHLKELLHPRNDPVDLPYSFSVAVLEAGKSTYPHYLKQSEVYFILEGEGRLHIGNACFQLTKGSTARVPPKQEQWLENTGQSDLRFIVIVSPPWQAEDDIRL